METCPDGFGSIRTDAVNETYCFKEEVPLESEQDMESKWKLRVESSAHFQLQFYNILWFRFLRLYRVKFTLKIVDTNNIVDTINTNSKFLVTVVDGLGAW